MEKVSEQVNCNQNQNPKKVRGNEVRLLRPIEYLCPRSGLVLRQSAVL